MLTNDFWGTPMVHPGSHKSWRPLTVASFRVDVLVTWALWGGEGGAPNAAVGGANNGAANGAVVAGPTADALRDLFRARPLVARLNQVLAHALVAWLFARLARRLLVLCLL